MINSFSINKKNIFFQRINAIKSSITSYSIASVLDIVTILMISSIFNRLSEKSFNDKIPLYFLGTLLIIIFRTISVFLLRRYAFIKVFKKKLENEKIIVEKYINNRVKNSF